MTFSRIVFALLMVSSTFCSLPFWICYFWCGISDILDGLIARKLRQQSGIGAKLDS
ncbi:CDP-alcohol phosphatidyltransferase family protein, partial [Clostridioides difficile]|uniref:CDP-alcohol phosphatidyltransferase family protein n=1 Tax=Clostridioides difficile TaxID=1496 RepID=UPI002FE6DE44